MEKLKVPNSFLKVMMFTLTRFEDLLKGAFQDDVGAVIRIQVP